MYSLRPKHFVTLLFWLSKNFVTLWGLTHQAYFRMFLGKLKVAGLHYILSMC